MTVEEILERLKGLQRYNVFPNDYFPEETMTEKDDNGWSINYYDIERLIHEIEATQ